MILIIILILVVVSDICLSIYRDYRRGNTYKKSLAESKKENKELLVIGDPYSGFWNSYIHKSYGCGDTCLDLSSSKCTNSIQGDVLVELKKMKNNQYVIFESCVLEYVDQTQLEEIKNELYRVSGGDYYSVRISPNIFPTNISFIETGRII